MWLSFTNSLFLFEIRNFFVFCFCFFLWVGSRNQLMGTKFIIILYLEYRKPLLSIQMYIATCKSWCKWTSIIVILYMCMLKHRTVIFIRCPYLLDVYITSLNKQRRSSIKNKTTLLNWCCLMVLYKLNITDTKESQTKSRLISPFLIVITNIYYKQRMH